MFSPSEVYSVIMVGLNWPVKNLRSLLIIAVEELSTTNEIPYVSHKKRFSSGLTSVAKSVACKVGI